MGLQVWTGAALLYLFVVQFLTVDVASQATTTVNIVIDANQSGDGNTVGTTSVATGFTLQNSPTDITTGSILAISDNGLSDYSNGAIRGPGIGDVIFQNKNPPACPVNTRCIPTHMHFQSNRAGVGLIVINRSLSQNDNLIQVARMQITNLNAAYQSIATQYVLMTVTKTTKQPAWFRVRYNSLAEEQMKQSLRRGDCTHFNIYSLNPATTNGAIVVGWATRIGGCANKLVYDGAVVAYYALDGFNDPLYGEGDTVVHESGHWCNLLDQPTCGGPNSGTCITNNFMDCSQDECRSTFTQAQFTTMDTDLCSGRGMCRGGQSQASTSGSFAGPIVEVQPSAGG